MRAKILLVIIFILAMINNAIAKNFTDNGDGTVTDNETNLVWQQGEGEVMNWKAAIIHCEGLSLVGMNDWRLPNKRELFSLVDGSRFNPSIDITYFPNVYSENYCSSTTRSSNTSYGWCVSFLDGGVHINSKTSNSYVRCVRGGL